MKNNKNILFVALAICISISYVLPYHVHPFMGFYGDWLALLGVATTATLITEEKILNIHFPSIIIIPTGLIGIIGLQTLLGMLTVSWDAILPIAYLIGVAFSLVLGSTMSASKNGSPKLCGALVYAHLFAGLISVAIATMQFVGAEAIFLPLVMPMQHDVAIRPYANIGQPNQLALLFCLSIAAVWWLYQAGKLRAGIAIGMALFLLWGLVLTQSRIGWIIIPLFGLFAWLWQGKRDFKSISTWWIAGFVVSYIGLTIALPSIASILGAATTSAMEHIGSSSERLVLMQQAWQISLAHPWFGAGWYEFGPQQVQIGADFGPSVYSQHSHNIVLNFAAELGWPVTILVFGALGYWFYKGCLRRDISQEVAFATLFFVAVLVHSLVEFPLWYGYVLLPMAILMGMVHQEQFGTRAIQLSRVYVIALFTLMSVALVGVATDYRRVVVGFRALGWESLGIVADEGTTVKPYFTLFPQFYDYFRFAKTKAHEGMPSEEIVFMEHVAKRFGYAPVMMRMSLVYALNARPDDAMRSMKTISRLHPGDYAEAYQSWKNMADAEPGKYTAVFKRLAKPDPVFLKPIRNP